MSIFSYTHKSSPTIGGIHLEIVNLLYPVLARISAVSHVVWHATCATLSTFSNKGGRHHDYTELFC
jgi:hypothetical protein